MHLKTAIAAAFIALMAAGTSARAEVKLEAYHAYASHSPWQQELAKRFMEERPDVEITFRAPASTYDDAVVSIIRQSFSGGQPDIHFVGSHLLGELVARDLVQPMDDLLEGVDLKKEGYAEQTLALGQMNGHQYGLPWTSSTPVAFVNADLIRKAGGDPAAIPKDWDGFITLAGKVAKLGPDMMGMYWELGTDDWMTQNLLRSAGLDMMDAERKDVAFDNPQGLHAIDLFRRFHAEGGQQAIDMQAARQQFYAGKMGFYFVSTAAVRTFSREVGDRFELATAPVPSSSPNGGVVSGGMAGVILTKDPAKRQAAFDYLRFGTSAESQAYIVRNTGYMPTNTGALRADLLGDFYKKNPAWATSVGQIDRARPWFAWPGKNGSRIGQSINDHMTALANGQTTSQETLDGMVSDIRALLPDGS